MMARVYVGDVVEVTYNNQVMVGEVTQVSINNPSAVMISGIHKWFEMWECKIKHFGPRS